MLQTGAFKLEVSVGHVGYTITGASLSIIHGVILGAMADKNSARVKKANLVNALLLSNAVSIGMFLWQANYSDSNYYSFLVWNLFLAWLPFLFAYWLAKRMRSDYWLSWGSLGLTVLWFAFLPNSFYIASDFVHIGFRPGMVEEMMIDVGMIFLFTFNAYFAGFGSVFLVHRELIKRITAKHAHQAIAGVLFLSAFAIYLGRTLRWNTWDIVVDPAGLLLSVSDRFISPGEHPDMISVTLLYFATLGSIYTVVWTFLRYANFQPDKS